MGDSFETLSCTTDIERDKNPIKKHYIIVMNEKVTGHSWDQQEGQKEQAQADLFQL